MISRVWCGSVRESVRVFGTFWVNRIEQVRW